MASTTSHHLSLTSSSSALINVKSTHRQLSAAAATASSQCVTFPALPLLQSSQGRHATWKTAYYCRKVGRRCSYVVAMATGEAPAEVAETELPEIAKTVQEAWDKLEDKYAVTSLAVAVVIGLWVSTGMISAIDRLPLIPGVLELVGIGYTGWFAYRNLIFKPEREALIQKIKDTYNNIIGSS